MFVLHSINNAGGLGSWVTNLDALAHGEPGERFEAVHSTTARKIAREVAERWQERVQVNRVVGDELRPAYIISVDGSASAPAGMLVPAREVCKKDTGQPGACFCTACRAERKAAR